MSTVETRHLAAFPGDHVALCGAPLGDRPICESCVKGADARASKAQERLDSTMEEAERAAWAFLAAHTRATTRDEVAQAADALAKSLSRFADAGARKRTNSLTARVAAVIGCIPDDECDLVEAVRILQQEHDRWERVAIYLAHCHAATAGYDGKLSSVSKSRKQRYIDICKTAVTLLSGKEHPRRMVTNRTIRDELADVIERLERVLDQGERHE